MFERLREALDAVLDAASSPDDRGSQAEEMHRATEEMKTAVRELEDALRQTEGRVVAERQQLADAERRGHLARQINDAETVAIAEQYAEKHRAWVGVLEKKLDAQRHELSLVKTELEGMRTRAQEAARQGPAGEASDAVERAWREIERLGGTRPETDVHADALKAKLDRAVKERLAEEQLEELKRRMGR